MTTEFNTMNRFLVGVTGTGEFSMIPPRGPLTRDAALNLAAWLSVLADPMGDDFDALRKAIANT